MKRFNSLTILISTLLTLQFTTASEQLIASSSTDSSISKSLEQPQEKLITIKCSTGEELSISPRAFSHLKTIETLVHLKEQADLDPLIDFSRDQEITMKELKYLVSLIDYSHFLQKNIPHDHSLLKTSLLNHIDKKITDSTQLDKIAKQPDKNFLIGFLSLFNYLQFSIHNSECSDCISFDSAIDQEIIEQTEKKLATLLVQQNDFKSDTISILKQKLGIDTPILEKLKKELIGKVITTPKFITKALTEKRFGEWIFLPSSCTQEDLGISQCFSSCGTMIAQGTLLLQFLPNGNYQTTKIFEDNDYNTKLIGFNKKNTFLIASHAWNHNIYLYNVQTKKTTKHNFAQLLSLKFIPNSDFLMTHSCESNFLAFYDLESKTPSPFPIPYKCLNYHFSKSGTTISVLAKDDFNNFHLHTFDIKTKELLHSSPILSPLGSGDTLGSPDYFKLNPQGTILVFYSLENTSLHQNDYNFDEENRIILKTVSLKDKTEKVISINDFMLAPTIHFPLSFEFNHDGTVIKINNAKISLANEPFLYYDIINNKFMDDENYYFVPEKKSTLELSKVQELAIQEGCAYPVIDAGPLKFIGKADRILFNQDASFYVRRSPSSMSNPLVYQFELYASKEKVQEALARDNSLELIRLLVAAQREKKARPKIHFDFDKDRNLKANIKQ